MTNAIRSLTKSRTLQAFFVLGQDHRITGANGVEVLPMTVSVTHHDVDDTINLVVMVSCQVIGKRGKPIDDYTLIRYTRLAQMPQWLSELVKPHLPGSGGQCAGDETP